VYLSSILHRDLAARGEPAAAASQHQRALVLASDLCQPLDVARARDGLAHAHDALNQPEDARRHWQTALDILTGLGVKHTDDEEATVATIRCHLTRLDEQTHPTGPISRVDIRRS
jgi:hypothetical protein